MLAKDFLQRYLKERFMLVAWGILSLKFQSE